MPSAVYASVVDAIYDEADVQQILGQAMGTARTLMNPALADALDDSLDMSAFNEVVTEKAEDLLETALYLTISQGGDQGGFGSYDLSTLTPAGIVEFLDPFMTKSAGLLAELALDLQEAYQIYWSARGSLA